MTTPFTNKVISVIKSIPKGKVATYSQIARLAGKPHGTRGVVWILHSSSAEKSLPWHRVINAKGKISFPEMSDGFVRQKKLLKLEGIALDELGKIDLKKYQWSKKNLRKPTK